MWARTPILIVSSPWLWNYKIDTCFIWWVFISLLWNTQVFTVEFVRCESNKNNIMWKLVSSDWKVIKRFELNVDIDNFPNLLHCYVFNWKHINSNHVMKCDLTTVEGVLQTFELLDHVWLIVVLRLKLQSNDFIDLRYYPASFAPTTVRCRFGKEQLPAKKIKKSLVLMVCPVKLWTIFSKNYTFSVNYAPSCLLI